eukprot:CAMPEP_0174695200 /NCGR_PEP_ID=MMETSP1094-20130205/1635_1 /TAXON_ID=156173 /ORGANISM="Chrysochromulina brevifilum, Strain UTEX LB 985" /LENGTH=82 /DNA_ID=CAMNT_0015891641 /DNA_START=517 /DNA_END=762 /DNA_ORIENTATION=-
MLVATTPLPPSPSDGSLAIARAEEMMTESIGDTTTEELLRRGRRLIAARALSPRAAALDRSSPLSSPPTNRSYPPSSPRAPS